MFDSLYHYPSVLARHRECPSAEDRDRFLAHCADDGAARSTLLRLAPELLAIARRIDLRGSRYISLGEVETAANRWVGYQRRHHRIRASRFSREHFIQTASAWLRFLGRLQEPEQAPRAFAERADEFARYLRDERGLSPHTIHNRCWHVQAFLHWLGEQGSGFAALRLEQVDAFLALRREQGWCRVSMATAASALRSFFRHARGRRGIRVCYHELNRAWPLNSPETRHPV